ncbi:MAG: hypothetical protein PHX86_02345 [Caldisericia bacterium]|nr:hypothetical protein [Caldisericia bacterium]
MIQHRDPKTIFLLISLCVFMLFSSGFVFLPYSTIHLDTILDEDAKVISLSDHTGSHFILGTFIDNKSVDKQSNIFIRKLNEDFSKQLFEVQFGGSGNEYITDAFCSQDQLFICGSTRSIDLPITEDALLLEPPGWGDGFIAIFDLSGHLQYSSYIGGSSTDICTSFKKQGDDLYIVGTTWSEDFPITTDAFQKRLYGNTDTFYMKLNLSFYTLEYATYLGGSGEEYCAALCLVEDEPVLFGRTSSRDFFLTDNSYNQAFNGGEWDLFLISLSSSGSPLYSTYLGGSRNDFASDMEVAPDNTVYLTGRTYSSNYPITPTAIQLNMNGLSDGFVSIFNLKTKTLLFSSFFGGDKTEYPESITFIDTIPAITGRTFSENQFPLTSNALQRKFAGGWSDGFILCLDESDHSLLYASYLGGDDRDSIDSMVWSGHPNQVYIAGRTMSSSIPSKHVSYILEESGENRWNGFVMKYWLPVE